MRLGLFLEPDHDFAIDSAVSLIGRALRTPLLLAESPGRSHIGLRRLAHRLSLEDFKYSSIGLFDVCHGLICGEKLI